MIHFVVFPESIIIFPLRLLGEYQSILSLQTFATQLMSHVGIIPPGLSK